MLCLCTLAVSPPALGAFAAAPDTASPRIQAVVDAVRFAFGLELAYWEDPAAFRNRDAVYAHFRQGFSPDLAAAMTAHVLGGDGDLAAWVPEQVHVVELEAGHALVWFPTPASFGEQGLWDLDDYMHVRLRREGGGWVVDWARDRSAPPVR
jgi:hypothetical protein